MTAFNSKGELTRESLTDAPEGAWLDAFLESYNDLRRNTQSVLQKGISTADNTINAEKSLTLVHNVEVPCANPLKVPVKGIVPLMCEGLTLDSMGRPTSVVYQLDTPAISWRPNPLSTNGGVLVKAIYNPLGETVQSFVARTTIPVTSNIPFNITSVSLSAGKWSITALSNISGSLTGTGNIAVVNTSSAPSTGGTIGQSRMQDHYMPSGSDKQMIVPSLIVTPSVATTYYLHGNVTFTLGTATAGGNMVATKLACNGTVGRINLLFYGG